MIAAFFDIDGTIYRNALLIEHFKKMIKYELFKDVQYRLKVEEAYQLWDTRKGDYDDYLLDLAQLYVVAIKGLSLKYNDFISDQVLLLKGNRVYTYTREMIEWHKKQGHKVFFISGSPSFLVSRMAKKMGVDDFCGSVYEIDEETQTFSGRITKPMWDSAHKQEAIDDFIKKYDIDLSKSYAYGDTNGDYSMLSSVGNPRAINPSKELIKKIKDDENLRSKIQIIIERKNVIYKLDSNVELIEF
ncbi:HAD family hydrolase [uncultured Fusobacterium sp.]|uniref:HAD family hydrolase n=1 Tax=uncultured Fusobacterium sp. TaxID=159267 RepID=UPI00260B0C0D|nr:HAD family hydrolase [uncultured Fusobacterium sp.]